MLKYEWLKLRNTQGLRFLCIVLLIADIVLCGYFCRKDMSQGGDRDNFVSQENFNLQYKEALEKVISASEKTLFGYQYENIPQTSFAYRYQSAIIERYRFLQEKELSKSYTVKGWDFLLSYHAGEFFVFAAVLYLSSLSFPSEAKAGMLPIVRASRGGRFRFAGAKLFSGFLLSSLLVLLFKASEFLTVFSIKGIQGGGAPLKVLQDFFYTPFSLSVWEYYLLTLLSLTAAAAVLYFICAAISIATYNAPLSMILGALFLGSNLFLSGKYYGNSLFPLKMLSLCTTVHENLAEQRYQAMNLFGQAVSYSTVRPILWGILILVFLAVSLLLYNRKNLRVIDLKILSSVTSLIKRATAALQNRGAEKTIACRRYPTALVYWEIRKLVMRKQILIVPLALLSATYVIGSQRPTEIASKEEFYKDYMDRLSGEWTQEKQDSLYAEMEELSSVLMQKAEYEEKFLSQEISIEEYRAYNTLYESANLQRNYLRDIIEKSEYLEQVSIGKEKPAWFVYDTGWLAAFRTNDSLILIVSILFLFHEVFSREVSSGFSSILLCSKRGREKTAGSKLLAVTLVSFLLASAMTAVELYVLSRLYLFPLPSAPLYSLPLFQNYNGGLTIGQFVLLTVGVKIGGSVLLSAAIAALSGIFTNAIPTVLVGLVGCSVPNLLSGLGLRLFEYGKVSDILAAVPLLTRSFQGSDPYLLASVTILLFLGLTSGLCLLARKKWS